MENILKIVIIFAFLSLLVDAAVSTPASPEARALLKIKLGLKLDKGMGDLIAIQKKFIPKLNGLQHKLQKSLTRREVSALSDCGVMSIDTLNQIISSQGIVRKYSESKDISVLAAHKVELYNLLSAAQTNVLTCLDGFSHTRADKKVQASNLKAYLEKMHNLANILMSVADEMFKKLKAPPVKSGMGEEWPEWLSANDRKLLQDPAVKVVADLTVAPGETGAYQTVAEAVAKAKEDAPKKKSGKRFVIRIKEGEYMENVVIPKDLTNLMFVGDGQSNTIITASGNVVDGDTTFSSATLGVAGNGFLARDITFKNTAGPSKKQAVALRVNADRAVFYGCSMIGYQNTLYVHSLRQFYKKCIISGTVDFIFGNAAAFFLDCDIQAGVPNPGQKNTITAQGRTHPSQNTGIIVQKCRITATPDAEGKFTTYLGRPWMAYSRTVVMQTEISNVIHPAGWSEWDGKFALDTLYYAEYNNTGDGAETESRVKWKGFQVLTKEKEVEPFTIENFLGS